MVLQRTGYVHLTLYLSTANETDILWSADSLSAFLRRAAPTESTILPNVLRQFDRQLFLLHLHHCTKVYYTYYTTVFSVFEPQFHREKQAWASSLCSEYNSLWSVRLIWQKYLKSSYWWYLCLQKLQHYNITGAK